MLNKKNRKEEHLSKLLSYLGIELFQNMLDHYVPRYQLAVERGYTEVGSQYY